MAEKIVSEFARAHSQNSKASLDAEILALRNTIDEIVVKLRPLMTRLIELEVGSRIMFGISPEREAKSISAKPIAANTDKDVAAEGGVLAG